MLDKTLSIRVEQRGGSKTYIFKCAKIPCDNLISCRASYLKKASGFCAVHSHQKRPFEHIFKSIDKDGRNKGSTLTYEEFLTFTTITECHYCLDHIPWEEFAYVKGKFTSKAYYLDRKFNNKPYSLENCVVCCTHCNRMKSSLDYNDFIVKCSLIADVYAKRVFPP
jgi:hypothetical protein